MQRAGFFISGLISPAPLFPKAYTDIKEVTLCFPSGKKPLQCHLTELNRTSKGPVKFDVTSEGKSEQYRCRAKTWDAVMADLKTEQILWRFSPLREKRTKAEGFKQSQMCRLPQCKSEAGLCGWQPPQQGTHCSNPDCWITVSYSRQSICCLSHLPTCLGSSTQLKGKLQSKICY